MHIADALVFGGVLNAEAMNPLFRSSILFDDIFDVLGVDAFQIPNLRFIFLSKAKSLFLGAAGLLLRDFYFLDVSFDFLLQLLNQTVFERKTNVCLVNDDSGFIQIVCQQLYLFKVLCFPFGELPPQENVLFFRSVLQLS